MSEPVPSKMTVIYGGTVIDGNGGPSIKEGIVIIEGERIVAVRGIDTPIPANARTIDAREKYVIPGLMDANVHLVFGFSTEYLVRYEDRFDAIIREGAQIALKSGVTTVFDTWGPMGPLQRVRGEINRGEVQASRVFLAGNIVGLSGPFSSDFYADPASVSKETVRRINAMYENGTGRELIYMSKSQVRLAIEEYLRNDIDFVKYAVSGHARADWGFLLFSPAVQRVIIDLARDRGLKVQTHSTSVESLRLAVEASVDLMQHPDNTAGEVIPDELIQQIVDGKIPCAIMFDPERYLAHFLGKHRHADPGDIPDGRARTLAALARNRRRLVESGARVVMMTDGGVPCPGEPLLDDLLFQNSYEEISEDICGFFGTGVAAWMRGAADAGLSPMASLQAATLNVAAAYGKSRDLGTLECGKIADIVILRNDPLSSPEHYRTIEAVIKAGEIVDLAALPSQRVVTEQKFRAGRMPCCAP